jgi:chemosensory pili system protein ChpA (sensor histidine kinase/response regulator)
METRLEYVLAAAAVTPQFIDELEVSFDRANFLLDGLQKRAAGVIEEVPEAPSAAAPSGPVLVERHAAEETEAEAAAVRAMLRVRADLIDRLVNEAGEMSIARSRIEGEMRTLRGSLLDLTENVIRLRGQLREIEIQAESQMQSRMALAHEAHAGFDPLEFDRFTRFQEITRMMAESVNDVTTVQHALLRNLDHADAAIVSQARQNRELSQALMGIRMVPFNSVADRLYRVVRLTAKEMGKKANLDIRGGQVELDRSVLEKMTGPIEHLLRNAITHGMEETARRQAAGKPEIGEVSLTLSQEGNEVAIEMADDGAGLDFARIRGKAIEQGLLAPDQQVDDAALTDFIFQPGFSTAKELTEAAGRGVGMDVVKAETAQLGGRIEVSSVAGKGARFRIYLPLTLAVTQALLVRLGSRTYAIPSVMVEQVMELKEEALARIRAEGAAEWLGNRYPYHYLQRLLGDSHAQPEQQRRYSVLLLRGGNQRVSVQVDQLRGNQEVVIKNIGPQLARVIGIAGATVLGDGEVVLILNPVALASREVKALSQEAEVPMAPAAEAPAAPRLPTVMIVDDSLTVRKITGRLLSREGYHVVAAKDGVDALEQLLDIVPDVMLVDIEMPRMDGFDLTRNVRADARLKDVPIIMITSRTADKHRNYAKEIGVNHYLGKPYQEEELLGLIAGYTRRPAAATA